MKVSLHDRLQNKLAKGMAILLGVVLLAGLSAFQVSATHASEDSTEGSRKLTNLRTTFVLGGYGPAIAMINEREGWGNSFQGTVHTNDGGKTWQTVAKIDQRIGGPDFVFDGQTLWDHTFDPDTYQTLSLIRTNDGGKTWTSFANPEPGLDPSDFSVIDRQRSWVYLYDYNTNSQALYLVGTSGQDWKKATLPGQDRIKNIYFVSESKGWVFTDQALYLTTDGAQTWVKLDLPRPAGIGSTALLRTVPLGFASANLGFFRITFTDPETFARSTYVYKTVDGGLTWNPYGGAQPADTDNIAQIDNWNLSNPALAGVRPGHGPQVVLAKLQQGQWKTETFTPPEQVLARNVSFFYSRLSAKTIFLSVDASDYPTHALDLYKTTDGGQSWQKISSTPGQPA